MANSVESYINAQPEQAMSYGEFYAQQPGSITSDYNNLFVRIGDWLSGHGKKTQDAYQNYLDNLDRRNEFAAVQSARQYEKMMDDTKYQRMMKDFEAAGLNPYLMINNGGISASSAPSAAKGDYARRGKGMSDNKSESGRNIALLLVACARLAATLL